MPVVVTPAARSTAVGAFDIAAEEPDPVAAVGAWRDADADALVVDTLDETVPTAVRTARDGNTVPLLLVTPNGACGLPIDAVLDPEAPPDAADRAVMRARAARDYRDAVTELFEACRDRTAGQPDSSVRRLRYRADLAFDDLDGSLPPSAFTVPSDDEP